MPWASIEPTEDQFDNGTVSWVDSLVQAANTRGIKPVLVLH